MKSVYLDHAATTYIHDEVIVAMQEAMYNWGNPSALHQTGRKAKAGIEAARKSMAKELAVLPSELYFTASATEGINWVLRAFVVEKGIQTIVTSRMEHAAVLETLAYLQSSHTINVVYVPVLPNGLLDYDFLLNFLSQNNSVLVCLMAVNNEIGSILDVDTVGKWCQQYQHYFMIDAVQAIGKLSFNHENVTVFVGSAHKFYGPKGAGLVYIKSGTGLQGMLKGGEQEKGLRAGTEAIHQIVGMAKALEISCKEQLNNWQHFLDLKAYLIRQLKMNVPTAKVIDAQEVFVSYIVQIILPHSTVNPSMLLFQLDMMGVAASRGSACQSGSSTPSHVLEAFLPTNYLRFPNIRISFSPKNTTEDIDILIACLLKINQLNNSIR